MKDLIILAADPSMKLVLEAILDRPESLGIRPLQREQWRILTESLRDPAVFLRGHELLRSQAATYRYGILICDRDGSGQQGRTANTMEADMQTNLDKAGWSGRSAAIVIDPELEVWAFSKSPHFADVLGWSDLTQLRQWLIERGHRFDANGKPNNPKEAIEEALRHKRIPYSSSILVEVAKKVGFKNCQDSSFKRLRSTLQGWFPT